VEIRPCIIFLASCHHSLVTPSQKARPVIEVAIPSDFAVSQNIPVEVNPILGGEQVGEFR
jgi:hypothetical protein